MRIKLGWAVPLMLLAIAATVIVTWFAAARTSNVSPAQTTATSLTQISRADLSTSQLLTGSLGYGAATTVVAPGIPRGSIIGDPGAIYTSLPPVGSVITRGQSIYSINLHPACLLYGSTPAFRQLQLDISGPDVQELEQNLMALGFATPSTLTADGHFSIADRLAVMRWQAALQVAQTGVVALGDVIFLPGPARIAGWHATPGSFAQAGQPVMDVTGATRLVTVALNPAMAYEVRTGDRVFVSLPDGHSHVPGTVSEVGKVATTATTSDQGQGLTAAAQAQVNVTITFDDASQVPDLDQAPVSVEIMTQSVKDVLVVPVNALLALAGGGYGLEIIEPSGQHRLVPVHIGIFDNSRVEVSGSGLGAGMAVVVPAP